MYLEESWNPTPYEGQDVLMNYQRRLFLFFIQSPETAKLDHHPKSDVCRLCLHPPMTKVASSSRLLALLGWRWRNWCGEGCLHSTSLHHVDSRPNILTSGGHSHPSSVLPNLSALPQATVASTQHFYSSFQFFLSLRVSGNFPHL